VPYISLFRFISLLYLLPVAIAQSPSDDNAILHTSGFVDDIMFSQHRAEKMMIFEFARW